ncbi:MAG: NAD(P)/FAD-dependent oxidoreductase [Candidatus Altimarinota bacterium]
MKKIAIIGGGAAGLMCAATLIEEHLDAEIHLFERNPHLGAKVIISGGGRCNVTTGITDKKILFSKYTRGADFIKTAMYDFPPEKVFEWFESHGVPLKIEEDLRVFPRSNKGKDVVGAFEKLFEKNKVRVHLNQTILSVERKENAFLLRTPDSELRTDVVVLTTGGNAYQHTGSKGDGYTFAQACGHSITKLGPSLNSFLTQEEWPKKLSGLSLDNAKLEAVAEDGEMKSAIGPIIFTHFGISGPATFALSSHLAFTPISKDTALQIKIIPRAEMNAHQWDETLKMKFQENGARQVNNLLNEYLPHRLVDTLLELAGIAPQKKAAELSKKDRINIIDLLTGKLTVHFIARRPGDEFVTAGGVVLSEVDPKTMQSKMCPGLFFAGEILDVDGVTGGFNLQSSWATGRLAGKSICDSLNPQPLTRGAPMPRK